VVWSLLVLSRVIVFFRKLLKLDDRVIRAGIDDFRWHDLRHTWASWHVQNGTSLQELQQLGGWSNFETVLRYAHLSSNHLRDASERICIVNP
jgi:site-specific recombinase XerD